MSWFSELFHGGKNPANAAMPFYGQIPGMTQPYQQPFFNAGTGALPNLDKQYQGLTNDPGGMMNKFGESYKESPGFKFAMEQALMGGDRAAAAGGMAGTPSHQFQNMQMATNLANQDYNNWMKNTLGLYGSGLTGQQGMANMGQQAGQNMSDQIAQMLAQQGNLAFSGQAQQNQNKNDLWGNIFKGIGSAASFNPWGMFGNI